MNQFELSARIASQLEQHQERLKKEWTLHPIRSCVLDSLLGMELAQSVYDSFPSPADMVLKNAIRERKCISAALDKHEPLIRDILFAFQERSILNILEEITGLRALEPARSPAIRRRHQPYDTRPFS